MLEKDGQPVEDSGQPVETNDPSSCSCCGVVCDQAQIFAELSGFSTNKCGCSPTASAGEWFIINELNIDGTYTLDSGGTEPVGASCNDTGDCQFQYAEASDSATEIVVESYSDDTCDTEEADSPDSVSLRTITVNMNNSDQVTCVRVENHPPDNLASPPTVIFVASANGPWALGDSIANELSCGGDNIADGGTVTVTAS